MSDYQEAIQNPARCFSDAALIAGTPKVNALGLPVPVTGGFCSVYQVTSAKSRWAVRCFLHDFADQQDRYAEISGYLKRKRPRQMVDFDYLAEGIRIRKQWHPVLKMEWVDGDTLDQWVGRHVQDAGALRKLGEHWVGLLAELERHQIGHCDLQHGNVLVDGAGQLRLIDYDGMYVPPLRGRGSHEKGHPAFQHPQRDGDDFDERVDRFPALVVHVSLVALATRPALWERYHDDDNLLFKRSDFADPDRSRVFEELSGMVGEVADGAALLREACRRGYGEAPRLRDVVGGKGRILKLPVAGRQASSRPAEGAALTTIAEAVAGMWRRVSGGGWINVATAEVVTASASVVPMVQAASNAAPARAATPAKSVQPAKPPKPARPSPSKSVAVVPLSPPTHAGTTNGPAGRPAWLASPPAAGSTTTVGAGTARSNLALPPGGTLPSTARRPGTRRTTVVAGNASPSAAADGSTGWGHEWTRPGESPERHIWKLPVYGTRRVARSLFGVPLGTWPERFVERHDERVVERGQRVAGHRAAITSLEFTSDGRLLASAARDGALRLWHANTGREVCTPLETRSRVVAMAVVPGRHLLVAACANRQLVMWDFGVPRQVIHMYTPDRAAVRAIAVSSDGRWLAAGVARGRIHVWPLAGEEWAHEITGVSGRIDALAFTPGADAIVCSTHKSRVERFELATGALAWSVRSSAGRLRRLMVPVQGEGLLGASRTGMVVRWDLADGNESMSRRPGPDRLASFAATPATTLWLVGTNAGNASLCESDSGEERAAFTNHPGAVTATALASDGATAATGCADGSVRMWRCR